jgi:hypothetical protein
MSKPSSLKQLFEQAIKRLPPTLERGDTEGSFEPDENGCVTVEQGLSACIRQFLDAEILAFGSIRLEANGANIDISAGFDIVLDQGGERDSFYGHHVMQLHYDVAGRRWGTPYIC